MIEFTINGFFVAIYFAGGFFSVGMYIADCISDGEEFKFNMLLWVFIFSWFALGAVLYWKITNKNP